MDMNDDKPKDDKPKMDNPEQSRRFVEAAREAETGDDPQPFEKVFKVLASKRTAAKPSS